MWAARTCAKMNCVSVRSYIRICAEGVFQSSRAICTVSPCLQNGVDLSSSPPAPSPHTYTRRKLLKAIVLPIDLTRAFDAPRCAKSVRAVVRRLVFAPPKQLLFSEWFLSFSGVRFHGRHVCRIACRHTSRRTVMLRIAMFIFVPISHFQFGCTFAIGRFWKAQSNKLDANAAPAVLFLLSFTTEQVIFYFIFTQKR